MLNYGWLIPAIPAVSFVLILFFGKHLPRKGSELGILAVNVVVNLIPAHRRPKVRILAIAATRRGRPRLMRSFPQPLRLDAGVDAGPGGAAGALVAGDLVDRPVGDLA